MAVHSCRIENNGLISFYLDLCAMEFIIFLFQCQVLLEIRQRREATDTNSLSEYSAEFATASAVFLTPLPGSYSRDQFAWMRVCRACSASVSFNCFICRAAWSWPLPFSF